MKLRPYKGFEGAVTFVDTEANTLTAEAVNVDAMIHAEAGTPADLQREWEASVDTYLEVCAERGVDPMKPFSGQLNLRLGAELHRAAHAAARTAGMSLNAWIKEAVTRGVGQSEAPTPLVRMSGPVGIVSKPVEKTSQGSGRVFRLGPAKRPSVQVPLKRGKAPDVKVIKKGMRVGLAAGIKVSRNMGNVAEAHGPGKGHPKLSEAADTKQGRSTKKIGREAKKAPR